MNATAIGGCWLVLSSILLSCGSESASSLDAGDAELSTDATTSTPSSCTFLGATGPGPDGQWDNDDDEYVNSVHYEFDDAGRTRLVTSWRPGPDGKTGTFDDEVNRQDRFVYEDARVSTVSGYGAPGPDATWGTDDDIQISLIANTYAASGRYWSEQATYNEPGPDGLWGTGDDILENRRVNETFGESGPNRQVVYDDPGDDGIWRTSDDRVYVALCMDYGPALEINITRSHTPGVDQLWCTDDDPVFAAETGSCNENVRTAVLFTSPGPDEIWGTDDDVITSRFNLSSQNGCPLDLCRIID